ncbi:FAD binding domain-containing protein [Xylariaceae sp. FL0594]|nr:FAD binding domain-containing protein [Xylariaceae sp. FL0594]
MSSGKNEFRVIIVGGGPAGLTAAHALSKAGIDFVLLERRPVIVEDVGASLVLETRTLRVLAQLGLLNPVSDISTDIDGNCAMTEDGVEFSMDPSLSWNERYLGHNAIVLHRADYLQVLYEELGELKSKVYTDKKVLEISCSEAGVSVSCVDGTRYEGSVVLGADGVHSQVRRLMRTLALEKKRPQEASSVGVNPEKPFVAEYRLMWCSFPRQLGFRAGWDWQTHGAHFSVQHITSNNRAWFFLYERLERPTRGRATYTPNDAAAMVERLGDVHIGRRLRIRDMYAQRDRCGMANLEEGILDHWSWERLVLVGDAAHKVTPNIGQGYNNGVQDVVVLTNELYGLLNPSSSSSSLEKERSDAVDKVDQPTVQDLAAAFKRYQASRRETIVSDFKLSALVTRLCAWRNLIYWFVDRYVVPNLPLWARVKMYEKTQAEKHAAGSILSFVKCKEPFSGTWPWRYKMSRD